MSVDNRTPFPAIVFRQYNLRGDLNGVLAVRGTFKLNGDGSLILDERQYPLVMSDVYDGDPHQTPHLMQGDLVPFKPGTDVTLLGFSYAPEFKPCHSWTTRLSVGPIDKSLRVYGPRSWIARSRKSWAGLFDRRKEDAFDGWEIIAAEPVERVPLDWRLAFGGQPQGLAQDHDELSERNPLGCGRVDRTQFRDHPPWPAPQVEVMDMPIADPDQSNTTPGGFGPLSPWWADRYRYAGTYDEQWLAERHPLLPADFDYRFYQCAPPDQVAMPWLQGNEPFTLENLLPRRPLLTGALPNIELMVELDQGSGPARARLVLDGVHFDFRPDVGRVFLTWRVGFPWPKRRGLPKLIYGAAKGKVAS